MEWKWTAKYLIVLVYFIILETTICQEHEINEEIIEISSTEQIPKRLRDETGSSENGDGDENDDGYLTEDEQKKFHEEIGRDKDNSHHYHESTGGENRDNDEAEVVEESHFDESTKKNMDGRPNIILILTDDQDVELGSMEYMPETLKIFRDNGVEFRHGYTSTPMCCPSRSSLLTGLYVHNHNVYTNNDNCSSILWREKHEKQTFGAHLWSSGYYTSYIGKYLNKYDGSHIPYGWDEWNGLSMNSRFYNYTVNVNGKKRKHGNDYETDYYPDVIANDTLDFLSRVGRDESRRPFLLVSSFPSPHGPEDSAPQYSQMFLNATPHHTPSYNYAPNSDKQWILRQTEPMTPLLKEFTNLLMTKRLQTLQSVDKAVKDIMDQLRSTGLDENTYVFYTSDHGYHVGQFGLVKGKSMPYEFDIRVPFFLHGPSSAVKAGTKILEPVMNIDIAPTFLDLAGVTIPVEMDGRSMVPLIQRYGPKYEEGEGAQFVWKDVFLIESSGRREIPMDSVSSHSPKKNKKLREEKRKFFFEDNETVRMSNLCLLHPHPCVPGQKKYCRKDKDRVHFRKCRQSDFLLEPYSIHVNDPLYQVVGPNGTFSPQSSLKRCRCRFRRSSSNDDGLDPEEEEDEVDWENERKRIDEEIELLKKRIDNLRNKRRHLRRKWLAEQNQGSSTPVPKREGKSHDPEEEGMSTTQNGNEEKVFSPHDFEENEEPFVTEADPERNSDAEYQNHRLRIQDHEEDADDEGDTDTEDHDDDSEDELEEHEEHDHDDNYDSVVINPTLNPSSDDDKSIVDIPITKIPSEVNFTQEESPRIVSTVSSTETEGKRRSEPEDRLTGQGQIEGFGKISQFIQAPLSPHKGRDKGRHRGKNRHNKHKTSHANRGEDILVQESEIESFEESQCDCYSDPRWIRQRERDERKRKKLLSKIRKKQKYMKRIGDPEIRKQAETCGTEEKMNCFWHDRDHWKTAPFWNNEPFCFCMNSNNNTYSCLRSVNATHNYLYCQFVTGFKMYFDLTQDPYQLKNAIGTLPAAQEDWMLVQLIRLKKCKGREECWAEIDENEQAIQSSIWEQIFGRWPRKKKRGNRKRNNF